MTLRSEAGYGLAEMLVALTLFLVIIGGVYTLMFSGAEGSDTARSVAHISEEARLTLNRLIRDTREGDALSAVTPSSYNVKVDFDGDGIYENPNQSGDYEDLSISFDPGAGTIDLNGQLLVDGIEVVPGKHLFTYSSNFLEFDSNGDGVTTWEELDMATDSAVGNGNGLLDGLELAYISSVNVAVRITEGDESADFYAEAQLRNRR
jgi:hypothetical protein